MQRRMRVVRGLAQLAELGVLRWSGHVERIEEECLVKKITISDVRGVRPRGRPRMGWMDSVKRALGARGMSVEQGRVVVHDRNEWRATVNASILTQPRQPQWEFLMHLIQSADCFRCEEGDWIYYDVGGVNQSGVGP